MLDILSREDAHRFAAEQRIAAMQHMMTAERLAQRALGFLKRAEIAEANAVAWDQAARGEWEDMT